MLVGKDALVGDVPELIKLSLFKASGSEDDEGSNFESLVSSHSSGFGNDMVLDNNEENNDFIFSGIKEENTHRLSFNNYLDILQFYDDGEKIHKKDLKREKRKILRYKPGAWIEKVGGLEKSDYDVPKTTCLLMVGPSGSDNSFTENGTYFLQEYMMPRYSNSFCLYDTRGLSDNLDRYDNIRMLEDWMTEGVRHGELVLRETDNERLRKSLESKVHKKDHSSQTRKVNFVIYVVNALLVVNAMNDSSDSETDYIETIVSTFNYPSLSFKDDKPVLVFTHGDLLSRTERAHVRGRLGKLLGIPPTKQIFDIPNSDCPATESAIIGMLRYSLAHADRNLPQKCKVLGYKVHKFFSPVYMIFLILGIGVAIGMGQRAEVHVPFSKTKFLNNNSGIFQI
ncbi:unnamed protein product [Sphenostylis stenocarpa]|uniref:Uncharacterized protein n=1 Tax=Sphenostylis stenocarpa TaxID=92480 RepID=A0AA86V8C9_9FABA|nr:unnamed protein product [Sphenostylis stenocarpa]